jgi:hypothetical protein
MGLARGWPVSFGHKSLLALRALQVLTVHAFAVCVIDSGLAVWADEHQSFPDLFPIQLFAAWHSRSQAKFGVVLEPSAK